MSSKAGSHGAFARLTKLGDELIQAVAPGMAVRRAQARAQLDIVEQLSMRRYEGGSHSRRTEGWRAPSSDSNEAARWQIQTLRDRCRDLERNNVWAGRGIRTMTRSVVGTGIVSSFVDSKLQPLDSARGAEMLKRWNRWAILTREIDADGLCNLYGLQRLVQRAIEDSGEVLVRRRWRRASDGLTVPLQLQVLEADHLDRMQDGPGRTASGEEVLRINGVEFDALGRRRGYWLFRDHPGTSYRRDVRSSFVPTSEILHLYRLDRPGQVFGIPSLAPAIVRVRDLDEWEDAWLLRNKLAAMFAGYIQDRADAEVPPLPGQTERTDGKSEVRFEPGMIGDVPAGKQIVFTDPPELGGYDEYTNSQLRAIAVATDCTYEQLTGDLRGTNFTSGRMGWITHFEAVEERRWHTLIPRFCDETFAWFLLACELVNVRLPTDVRPAWTPPKREMINPAEETAAAKLQVRCGFKSLSEVQREYGYQRDEVLEELSADMEAARGRGLMLETDPEADSNRNQPDTTGEHNNGGRTNATPPATPARK